MIRTQCTHTSDSLHAPFAVSSSVCADGFISGGVVRTAAIFLATPNELLYTKLFSNDMACVKDEDFDDDDDGEAR